MTSFLSQLQQRRVYRVAIGYAIVAWLMVQIAATVLPAFHAPEFVLPVLIVLLGVGGTLTTDRSGWRWRLLVLASPRNETHSRNLECRRRENRSWAGSGHFG